MKNGFSSISFEKISILDSYFIHRYIIIKYRSSSIVGKFCQLLWKLWPLFNFIFCKMLVSCWVSREKVGGGGGGREGV